MPPTNTRGRTDARPSRLDMQHWLRTLGRVVAWTTLALIFVLGLVLVVLQLPPVRSRVFDRIEREVDASLAGEFQAERISGPLLWTFTLHDVRVRDDRETPVLRADEMTIDYSIIPLLRGRQELDRLQLETPFVFVRRYEDGTLNLSHVAAPPEPPEVPAPPTRLDLWTYQIDRGLVLYHDRMASAGEHTETIDAEIQQLLERSFDADEPFDVAPLRDSFQAMRSANMSTETPRTALLEGLEATGGYHTETDGSVRASLRRIQFEMDASTLPRPTSLSGERWRGDWSPTRLEVSLREGTFDETTTLERLEGTVRFAPDAADDGDSPPFETIEAELARFQLAPELLDLFPLRVDVASPIAFEGELDGSPSELATRASASVDPGGRLELEGTLDLVPPACDLTLQGRDLQSNRWIEGLASTVEAGRIEGRLQGSGTTIPTLDAETTWTFADLAIGDWLVSEANMRARAADRQFDLETLQIDSPYVDATARGRWAADETFEFEAEATTPEEGLPASLAKKWGLAPDELAVGDGRWSLQATGTYVRPGDEGALERLRRLDLSTDWQLEGVALKETRLERSTGELALDLEPVPEQGANRAWTIEANAEAGRGARAPYRWTSATFGANGKGRLALDAPSWGAALSQVSMQTTLKGVGWKGASFAFDAGNLAARLDRSNASTPMSWTLAGELEGATVQTYRGDSARVDLEGTFQPGGSEKGRTPGRVTVNGTFGGRGWQGDEMALGSIDGRLGLDGPPWVPNQKLAYDLEGRASGLDAGDTSIGSARVDLEGALRPAPSDASHPLDGLVARGDVSATGLDGATADAERIDATLELDGAPLVAGETLNYDVEATSSKMTAETAGSERATLDVAGSLRAASDHSNHPIEHVDAAGTWKASGLRLPYATSRTAEGQFDLEGAPFVPGKSLTYDLQNRASGVQMAAYRASSLEANASGSLQPSGSKNSGPLAALTSDGRIGLQQLEGPETSMASFGTEFRIEGVPLVPRESLDYDVTTTTSNAAFGTYRMDAATLALQGAIKAASKDAQGAIDSFSADGTLKGRRLRAPDWTLGSLDTELEFGGAPWSPGRTTTYDVEGSIGSPSWKRLDGETMTVDLSGEAVPAPPEAAEALQKIVSKGTVGVESLEGFGLAIREWRTKLDVAGPLNNPMGSIDSNFSKIGALGATFGSADFGLDLEQTRLFKIDTRLASALLPKLPLFLRAGGGYAMDPTSLQVKNLALGRPGIEWTLAEPARITQRDGETNIESFRLQGLGRPIELDGTYDFSDATSLQDLVDRLGLARLGALFDPNVLREQLSDELLRQLPSDWQKKLEEEIGGIRADDLKKKAEEEMKRRTEELKKKAEEERKRRTEELKKKAEEEAKRRSEELKKKTEEMKERGRKAAEELEKRSREAREAIPDELRNKLPAHLRKLSDDELKKKLPKDLRNMSERELENLSDESLRKKLPKDLQSPEKRLREEAEDEIRKRLPF